CCLVGMVLPGCSWSLDGGNKVGPAHKQGGQRAPKAGRRKRTGRNWGRTPRGLTTPPVPPIVIPDTPVKPARESGAVQPTQETNAVSTNSPHHGTTSIYALDVDAAPQQENANALTDEELADIPSSESPEKVRAAMPSKKGSSGTRNSVEKYRQSQVSK